MINIKCADNCSGCSACASACPCKCISMESDHEGFLYPHVDTDKCVSCGKCVEVCPIISPRSDLAQKPQAFAAWNLNDEIRKSSSSGGMFTLLAERILENGGVVFGAAFAGDYRSVHHIKVEVMADLSQLRGSKYLQSSIGNSYTEAKKCLDEGRPVLFTGTPCQIGGLREFLGRDYPLLYTQDIICHGVPSQKVWAKYVDCRENEAESKTKNAFFRNKIHGWKNFSVQLMFSNGIEYIDFFRNDLFMRGFLADLYLRPSCHSCKFKGLTRAADITLADFWGLNRLMPELDDDKGTSLVLIHSEKGQQLFEQVKAHIKYRQVDLDRAIEGNSPAVCSVKPHHNREKFFLAFEREPFPELVSKCLYQSPYVRAKGLLKRLASKLKRTLNFRRIT